MTIGAKSVSGSGKTGPHSVKTTEFSVGANSVTHSLLTFASESNNSQAEIMANNAVDMSKLKQVLRMFKNGGMSNRKIAETVDLYTLSSSSFLLLSTNTLCNSSLGGRAFRSSGSISSAVL